MTNTDQNGGRLPSTATWRERYRYTMRALVRDATRFNGHTMRAAPADLNTPHIDYMLRPGFVRQLAETASTLGSGLYQIEVHARYRHHRDNDRADLTIARQHLNQAAAALTRIAERKRGER